jgi:hypothetical protein
MSGVIRRVWQMGGFHRIPPISFIQVFVLKNFF